MTASADLAIRLRRAAFNQALAAADLRAIAPLLAPGAVLITGTDSAVLSGRKAQLAAWKQEFATSPRTVYSRTPATIEASPIEPIALELGHWQGVLSTSGTVLAQGSYSAKWRKLGADWVIEGEIFVTMG